MRDWVVSDVALVQADRLSVEVIGQGFVRGRWITQRTGCQSEARDEVLIQLTFNPEPHADACAIAIWNGGLEEAFTAQPDVTDKAESSSQGFQGRRALLLVLHGGSCAEQGRLYIRQIAVDLSYGIF